MDLPTERLPDNSARQMAEKAAAEMKRHMQEKETEGMLGKVKQFWKAGTLTNHWAFVFSLVLIVVFLLLLVLRPSFVMAHSKDGTFSFSVGKALIVSLVFAGIAAVLVANM